LRPLGWALLWILALYRGVRAPSQWSAHYYQLSWADGFYRRGLIGFLLTPFGCARFDPWFLRKLQVAAMVVALLVLWRLGRSAVALGLALFLAGDGGGFFCHLIGYPEQFLLVGALAAAWIDERGHPLAAGLLAAALILAHEMALLCVVPALAVLAVRRRAAPSALVRLLAPPAIATALLLLLVHPVDSAVVMDFLHRSAACGHLPARPDFLYPFAEPETLKVYYNRWELGLQILPLTAALALWVLSGASRPGDPLPLRWLTLAACLAPLLFGLIAWDSGRWLGASMFVGALLTAPEDGLSRRRALTGLPFALLLLTLQLNYMDGYAPRPLRHDAIRAFPADMAREWGRLPAR
jgi:hypothetical protein